MSVHAVATLLGNLALLALLAGALVEQWLLYRLPTWFAVALNRPYTGAARLPDVDDPTRLHGMVGTRRSVNYRWDLEVGGLLFARRQLSWGAGRGVPVGVVRFEAGKATVAFRGSPQFVLPLIGVFGTIGGIGLALDGEPIVAGVAVGAVSWVLTVPLAWLIRFNARVTLEKAVLPDLATALEDWLAGQPD